MSGPAVLKLSAWEPEFCMIKLSVYHICQLLNDVETSEAEKIQRLKTRTRQKKRFQKSHFDFPFVGKPGAASELNETKWADPKHNCKLIQSIDKRTFQVNGKVL
jgi:hypothetical protein